MALRPDPVRADCPRIAVHERRRLPRPDRRLRSTSSSIGRRLAKLTERAHHDDGGVLFEQLGLGHLMIDEAHLAKNLAFPCPSTPATAAAPVAATTPPLRDGLAVITPQEAETSCPVTPPRFPLRPRTPVRGRYAYMPVSIGVVVDDGLPLVSGVRPDSQRGNTWRSERDDVQMSLPEGAIRKVQRATDHLVALRAAEDRFRAASPYSIVRARVA